MNPIFHYSNFLVSKLCKGVVEFQIPEHDFRCRIWTDQLPHIMDFLVQGASALFFSEEVWDITCNHHEIEITQISDVEYRIVCTNLENDRDDFVYDYILSAGDFKTMMDAIISSLEVNCVDKS